MTGKRCAIDADPARPDRGRRSVRGSWPAHGGLRPEGVTPESLKRGNAIAATRDLTRRPQGLCMSLRRRSPARGTPPLALPGPNPRTISVPGTMMRRDDRDPSFFLNADRVTGAADRTVRPARRTRP